MSGNGLYLSLYQVYEQWIVIWRTSEHNRKTQPVIHYISEWRYNLSKGGIKGGMYLQSKSEPNSILNKTIMWYNDYLKSKQWEEKKIQVFKEKWKLCQKCCSDKNINVHHWSYKKKYKEPIEHLFVLCRDCHEAFHLKYNMSESMMAKTMNFIFWKWWKKREARKLKLLNK